MSQGTTESKQLSIAIQRDIESAYAILSVVENFPKWASGMATTLTQSGGEWLADSPAGPVRLRFSPPNAFAVLDHWVHLASGQEIYIPLRLVANNSGCELIFTLFRQPGMTDETFAADADWVRRDLSAAKAFLEAE